MVACLKALSMCLDNTIQYQTDKKGKIIVPWESHTDLKKNWTPRYKASTGCIVSTQAHEKVKEHRITFGLDGLPVL